LDIIHQQLETQLQPLKGTLSMPAMAREKGLNHLIVPEANAREAAVAGCLSTSNI
jgi:predicted ATPase with chaperone activity